MKRATKCMAATKAAPMERLALSVKEFAAVSGISPGLLYKLWKNGKGPPFKKLGEGRGARRIIETEAGRQWLARSDVREEEDA